MLILSKFTAFSQCFASSLQPIPCCLCLPPSLPMCCLILSACWSWPVLFLLLYMARADLLVSRQGAPEPPRAPAVLLAASDHLRARPRSRVAALRPQWALAGALPAHAARWPPPSGVSNVHSVNFILKDIFFRHLFICTSVTTEYDRLCTAHLIRLLVFLLGLTMKTGLLFWTKRELVCCPPWLLVRTSLSSIELNWIEFILGMQIID